jgi:hypothetical protein
MTDSPSVPPQPDPLKPVLADAEAELRRRLHEACEAEAKGVSTDSTHEIRQLEDSLLAAAVAAEHTITVRRHMKRRGSTEHERPIDVGAAADRGEKTGTRVEPTSGESAAGDEEKSATHVREFRDDVGHSWRAWPVIPGLTRASAGGRQFLGNFQDGWICFEGLDTAGRRRLPWRAHNWANVTDEELQRLLGQAIDAPARMIKGKEKL